MPLDIPSIVAALRDLSRIVENPIPSEPNLVVFRWSEERYIESGRLKPEQTPSPDQLVRGGCEWALHHLMPSEVHIREDCPDITDSSLPLAAKKALLDIRYRLCDFFYWTALVTDPSNRIDLLMMIETAIAALAKKGRPPARHKTAIQVRVKALRDDTPETPWKDVYAAINKEFGTTYECGRAGMLHKLLSEYKELLKEGK